MNVCIEHQGPVRDTKLMTGEQVAIRQRRVLSRKDRCIVHVRIVGKSSCGWLDSTMLWGATVDAVVTRGGNLGHICQQLYPNVLITSPDQAHTLPPHRIEWQGIVLSTISSDGEADDLKELVNLWLPHTVLVAFHSKHSRRKIQAWLPKSELFTDIYRLACHHEKFGGVTSSHWTVWVMTKLSQARRLNITRMTSANYPRTLQTALDDTRGPERVGRFEVRDAHAAGLAGFVKQHDEPFERHVYSGDMLGPDLVPFTTEDLRHFWVLAYSVFVPLGQVLRKADILELLAIWDYAGKIWYENMTQPFIHRLLLTRLLSPPAKIATTLSFALFQHFVEDLMPERVVVPVVIPEDSKLPTGTAALEGDAQQRIKAAVADDAAINFDFWAMPGETKAEVEARVLLRRFAKRWWCHNLRAEAEAFIQANGNLPSDIEAAEDCLRRAEGSDYWDWHQGSSLFFWRFPDDCGWRQDARDGVPFWHLTDPPKGMHFQNIPTETREDELQMRSKVFTIRFRWYMEPKFADLVVPTFPVLKVDEGGVRDIRAVWDAKRNGLNATLWAPKFCMPTCSDAKDLVVKWLPYPVGHYFEAGCPPQDYTQDEGRFIKTYQFDEDVGQMFHNFKMHKKERHSHGIRFFHTRNDGSEEEQSFWRWCVLNFGCLCSPYIACQGEERIMELCMGDPEDESNPFQWEYVLLNLPFDLSHDPSMPRVILIRKDGEMAIRKVVFVDDIHGAGRGLTPDALIGAQRRLAQLMNYYANQASPRKRRPPCLLPGAWIGSIIHCNQPFPMASTTAKKWIKAKKMLNWVWEQFDIPTPCTDPRGHVMQQGDEWNVNIDTAELRRVAGLWVHVTEVYEEGRCFLKGFFNAIEAFRGDRDIDGWRLADAMDTAKELEDLAEIEDDDVVREIAASGYPAFTKATPELVSHVFALLRLFQGDEPRKVWLRPTDAHKLRYMVADASREGFAAAVQFPEMTVEERDGLWTPEFSNKPSNLREAVNIGNHLLKDIRSGIHDGCEVWVATDNAVWAAVFNKGLSTSKELFELVVEIKLEAFEHGVFLHCFHISGNRMIATGIDGLSRGDRDSGVTLGYDIRDYIPLHVSAFDYPNNSLRTWCRSWMGTDFTEPLQPKDWFLKGQLPGIHVWAPPAAAALIALKELARARHKRPYHLTHVILIPRLLYQEEWRKRFEKEVDIWFALQPGHTPGYCGSNKTKWWELAVPCRRCQRRVTYQSGIICANYGVTRGCFQACDGAWCADCFVPSPLDPNVIKLPKDFTGATIEEVGEEERFMKARPGDHLATSFQCPNCHSQNIRGRDLKDDYMADACFESLCIRATLDAFWSRAKKTVGDHVREVRFMARYGSALGFLPMPPLGPFKLGQHNGMLQAILMEMRLLEPGRKKDQLTVMFGTARQIRATTTVLWEASPLSGSDIAFSSASVKGRYVATLCPSEGRWFQHFSLGCSVRMGDVVTQDRAYTIQVVLAMIDLFEARFQELGYAIPIREMEAIMFFIISCFGGFRGYETVWTDLAALRYDLEYCEQTDDESAVAWPVTGRFKNEHGVWGHYYIPIAGVTGSGVRIFEWSQRFVKRLELAGRTEGWAFRKADGKTRALAADYQDYIHTKLEHLQATTNLIDSQCNVREDYGNQRSGRRFFDTECINKKVSKTDIEFQECRWSTDRDAGGRTVHRSMVHTYAEIRNMEETLIRPSTTI